MYIKKGYITQNYVSEIEKRLYNNLPIEPFLQEILPLDTVGDDNLDDILKPGEKYIRLPYDFNHIIVTSRARVINLETLNMYSLRIGNVSFHLYVNAKGTKDTYKVNIKDIFESEGWSYNFEELKQSYIDNKWRFTEHLYKKK